MTEKVKKKIRRRKITDVIVRPQYKKSVKIGAKTTARNDRISTNLSLEPFNGCWVGFGYESDIEPGETIEEAKERVWEEVVNTVHRRCEEIVKEK